MSFTWIAQPLTGEQFESSRHPFSAVPQDRLAKFRLQSPHRCVTVNLLTGEFEIDGQHVSHGELNNIRLMQEGAFKLAYQKNAAIDYAPNGGEVFDRGVQSGWIGWKGDKHFIIWEIYPDSGQVRLLVNEASKCPL